MHMTPADPSLKRHILLWLLLASTLSISVQAQDSTELEQAATAIRLRQYPQAAELLIPLAAQGNAEAQYQLASLYRSGRGVEQDLDAYLEMLTASANGGYARAQYQLGLAYEAGSLVPVDLDQARRWLSSAAEQDIQEAASRLEKLNTAVKEPQVAAELNPGSLRTAVLKGDNELVQQLLAAGTPVDEKDEHGRSPLLEAANSGRAEIVDTLLAAGADSNVQDNYGDAPVLAAVRAGHTEILASLLAHGANPDIRDPSNNTPLILAAGLNSQMMVQQLVNAGASLKLNNDRGWTAADTANARQYSALSAWLIKRGDTLKGSTGIQPSTSDRNAAPGEGQWTALMTAAWRGDRDKIRELSPSKTQLEQRDGAGQTALSLASRAGQSDAAQALLRLGAEPNSQQDNGYSPLMWASRNGNSELLSLLLEAGADPNHASADTHTCLSLAITSGSLQSVKLLLDAGAKLARAAGENAETPLMLAAEIANPEIVALLLEKGGRTGDVNSLGRSAIWLAARSDCGGCIQSLAKARADLDLPDNKGVPPLVIAANKGAVLSLDALLKSGANQGTKTPDGNTALLAASGAGQVAAAKLLLEAGADIDQRNSLGNTALIEATIGNRRDMVRLLLESGADSELRNRDRLTARAIAMQHKSVEVIEEFDKHAKNQKGIFSFLD